VILAGQTHAVTFADGRREIVAITNRDELRFEQREKISLSRVLNDGDGVPLWVVAGIVHWALLRSPVEGIPADYDEFVDLLDPDAWLEVLDEGKAAASAPAPDIGESPPSAGASESLPAT
jgi:hypothetical protein